MPTTNPVVKLNNVRLSFPALWTPVMETDENGNPKPGGKPKFGATFILDKKANAKDIAEVKRAIEQVRTTSDKLKGQKKAPKVSFRDGGEKEHLEGYGAGTMFLSAKSITRPGVVDQKLNPLAESDGKPYAGCYVNARVEVFAYVHPKSGPGITFGLKNVQFAKDGAGFGAGNGPADEGFEEVQEEETSVM